MSALSLITSALAWLRGIASRTIAWWRGLFSPSLRQQSQQVDALGSPGSDRIDGIALQRDGRRIWWQDGDLSIDYDGAPNAYAPVGYGAPLDSLANAGRGGKWWGIAVDAHNKPLVQGPGEPYPGYYISKTALAWPNRERTARYVDSTQISFLALPRELFGPPYNVRLGDFAHVTSTQTGRARMAIVADVGPRGKLGEGSIKLARELGVERGELRKRGIDVRIFVGSGDGKPRAEEEIQDMENPLTRGIVAWV